MGTMSLRAAPRTGPGRPARVPVWPAPLLAGVAVVAAVVMQARSADWFPPQHSMSQYANGPGSVAFTVALLALGAGSALLGARVRSFARSPAERAGWVLQLAAAAGFVIAALVRAEPAHLQWSINDRVHMAAATTGLVGLTLAGLLLGWRRRRSVSGLATLVLAAVSALALLLLVGAAYGVEPTGLGARPAWALHQTIALGCQALLLLVPASGGED